MFYVLHSDPISLELGLYNNHLRNYYLLLLLLLLNDAMNVFD